MFISLIQRVLLIAMVFCVMVTSSAQSLPAGKLGAFAVPKISKSPVIDGTIDAVEWREALAIGGLASQNPGGNLLIMRPTTYYLAWDADNIYVACRTWIMPGYIPRVSGRAPGTVNAFDDGMEFNLKPMGKNVVDGRTDSCYKFFISCFGSDGDLARVSVGQMFRNWRPYFKTATRLTDVGSAPMGGRWWEGEVILPAKDFELNGPNRVGDTWKMLLAFNHIPGFFQAAIPLNSGYFDPGGWPVMTLVENTPGVKVTMDELPGIKDGTAAVKINAFNPTNQTVTLNVLAQLEEWRGKTAEEILKKEQILTIEPGKSAEFAINEKLPREIGKNKGGLYFRVTQGDKELYRYYAYFELGYPENWVKYTPSKEAFPLSGTFNPVRNNFLITADAYYLDKPEMVKQVRYTVTREGESKAVISGTITKASYKSYTSLLQMPTLPEGTYNVEAFMDLSDGKSLGPVKTKFKKLDESKEFVAWWNNKIGNIERVIPPFTAIKRKGQQVNLWGRQYTLNALGMPKEILSNGKAISASAARIVAVIGGKEKVISLSGKLKFTEETAWRLGFTGKASGAGLLFTANGTIEQDGLVQVNLTYAPAGKMAVNVDALRLEFPLSNKDAETMNCMGPGGNFASLAAQILPTDKKGMLWNTLELGRGGTGMTVGSFYPDVWIGNEQRGFLWWGDSDKGWVPDDDVPAHEIWRVGNEVVLRNNIIGKPYQLTEPRTLAFTYNATPFKPFPKGWRATINAEDGTFSGPHKQYTDTKTGQKYDGTQWLSAPALPKDWERVWGEFKIQADAKVKATQPFDPLRARRTAWVHNSLALMGYGDRSSDWNLERYFSPEWDEHTLGESERNYFLWLADRAFTEGGLRSIYWDIFFIKAWDGVQNGMAYTLPDGRLQPTYNGLNMRRLVMRLNSLQEEKGLSPGGLSAHSSNCFPLVAYPWVGAGLDGEWAFMTDASPRDWVDNYTADRMRALNTPQNYGLPMTWMSINWITEPVKRGRVWRGFYDWARFHDCNWYGWDGYGPGQKLLDWGLNDERLQYVPHWRNTAITCDDKDVLVAYWQLPGRVMVMAFNYDGKVVKDPVLNIDYAKLGMTTKTTISTLSELRGIDTQNGQATGADPVPVLDVANGKISITLLQPHTARYFGIRVDESALISAIQKDFETIGNGAKLTDAMGDWGLINKDTKFLRDDKVIDVKSLATGIKIFMWQLPDRVLLAVVNTEKKDATATLDIDLDKLGLTPKLPWQEFLRVRDFTGGNSNLDFYNKKLTVGSIKPGTVKIVGIRRY
jgi:hypothetical protein